MTKEEKQLLLKDLCARQPYGVMCHIEIPHSFIGFVEKGDLVLNSITSDTLKCDFKSCWGIELKFIKPYLRPMSSLIEKELEECRATCKYRQVGQSVLDCATPETIDYLISHHFDYRGLIEKGLALKAPKDMYAQK